MMTTLFDSRSDTSTSLPEAIKTSQPLSGGLWSLRDIPNIDSAQIDAMVGQSYQDVAYTILSNFDFSLSENELKDIISKAYGSQRHHKEITPIKHIPGTNLHSLHLGYGPTFAFKNVALEFLPRLLSVLSPDKTINVLGASSGDTINAAHSGVQGTMINSIFMLPHTGPSYIQKLQATHGIVDNPNAFTLLSDESFDPLQDIVKKINSSEFADFKQTNNITSFNSINIARILAQVVYYFRSYTELIDQGSIKNGDMVNYSVPSGNFGNGLAAYYAKKMGLPINKILVATNENDMLDTFFKTGVYKPPKQDGRDFVAITNAPSMDIAKASNFERMLFDICNFDYEKIRGFYTKLATDGEFTVDQEMLQKIQETFISSSSTNQERLDAIKLFGDTYNHGVDPHTAAAIVPWIRKDFTPINTLPTIFLETSHVAQFGAELQKQGIVVPGMDEFDDIINIMKNKQPIKGTHYANISGDFQSTFATIQEAIQKQTARILNSK